MAHYTNDGVMPGLAAPERQHVDARKDDARWPAGTFGQKDYSDFSPGGMPMQGETAHAKIVATRRAELALLGGFTLVELADGSYLVTKWNCCRPLADLRAVTAFVRQVGGQRG
jgi:hypothetical protein